MMVGKVPFKAFRDDNMYKCFALNRSDIYSKRQLNADRHFSKGLQDLLTAAWELRPIQRGTIIDLLYHSWM